MELGILLTRCKHNGSFFEKAGYTLVPTHCDSELEVDQQFISNVDVMGKSHFPRFHILRVGKQYFIHYDYMVNGEHRSNVKKSPWYFIEIRRLRELSSVKVI